MGMRKDISGAPSNPEMALDQGNPGGSKAGSLDLDLPHGTLTWEEHIRRRHSLLPLRPAGSQPCSQRHLLFSFYTSMLLCVLKIIAECPITHTDVN